jgi:PadR family transcriptional regulator, regulatory protein PadR
MSNGEKRNRYFASKLNTTSIFKLFILHFLLKKDCYGNELIDKISYSLDHKITPSPGIIYPLLRDMEENLWVEGNWTEPDKKSKRIYKITDEGIKHYNSIRLIYKPMLEESMDIVEKTLKTIY